MKKIVKILVILLLLVVTKNVYAANYKIKELIPLKIKTTVVTKNFSYRKFQYNEGKIEFEGIKNLTDKDIPITISIGLFNKDKKNIGTINYCDYTIKSKEEATYEIDVTKDYLGKDYSVSDIKYISVLGDNINCRTTGSDEYIGQTVEEIGYAKNSTIDSDTSLTIKILSIVGGVIFLIFIYNLLFTRTYENVDGSDVRQGYRRVNEDLKKEKEEELRRNPPKPKEVKKVKTDEVLKQEEEASKEDKSATDLHNLYK